MIDFRLGKWQDALADVQTVDAVICDPPYGARTHSGNSNMFGRYSSNGKAKRDLNYLAWTPDDVRKFVAWWSPRCTGWICAMTSDDLIPIWRQAYAEAGRLDFAPVVIIQDRIRLGGDGPASCAVYLMVARPRRKEFLSWGALPGYYKSTTDREGNIGGKPLDLMRKIIANYSRPGDIVCDPTAGGATTLLAARDLGRRSIGAECDPMAFAKASERIASSERQPMLFTQETVEQDDLPW